MELKKIEQILRDTAFVRTGGTQEELNAAKYIMGVCAGMGLEAKLEPFAVDMADIREVHCYADGVEIPCKGYKCAGQADLEAPFYYMPSTDPLSLKAAKGKIVLVDSGMGFWLYHDLLEAGAVGFITYDGNVNYADEDIDQKELRSYVSQGNKIPGVNVNAKTARKLVANSTKTIRIVLSQDEYVGESRNVVMDMPGEIDEWIVLSAHYDSTSLSVGTYDNMTGAVGLLGIAENFIGKPHRYGLRFIWCGSEERGLLGAKAYVAAHEAEWDKFALNINLDMIGSTMGALMARCTTEEKLVHYIEYLAMEAGATVTCGSGVHSSDSTPFADKGIPAMSFARMGNPATGSIHNRYDTIEILKMENIAADIEFITLFTGRMANAVTCPVSRVIPDDIKDKIDIYNARKRAPKK